MTVQWFFRPEDTVRLFLEHKHLMEARFIPLLYVECCFVNYKHTINMNVVQIDISIVINHLPYVDVQMMTNRSYLIDKKRVFISEAKDENPLDSIVQKVKIALFPSDV